MPIKSKQSARIPIWLDCDPGIDDALAILLIAAHTGQLNLIGLSTVAGNGRLDRVTRNALALLEKFGLENVPVYKGYDRPLVREPITAEDVHGISGLGDYMPEPPGQRSIEDRDLAGMKEQLMKKGKERPVTICATAPLTNIALLIQNYPEVIPCIEKLIVMGGSSVGGNTNPVAEFNIQADPEAAAVVFDSRVPVVLCPLDVTLRSLILHEDIADFAKKPGHLYEMCNQMLRFYARSRSNIGRPGVPIHDAVTAACLLAPEMFTPIPAKVMVDCIADNNLCGKTTFDFHQQESTVQVLQDVNEQAFHQMMLDAIEQLQKKLEENQAG